MSETIIDTHAEAFGGKPKVVDDLKLKLKSLSQRQKMLLGAVIAVVIALIAYFVYDYQQKKAAEAAAPKAEGVRVRSKRSAYGTETGR